MRGNLTSHLSEAVYEKLEHAECLYHRLILIVGAEEVGKTAALRDLAERTGAPLINVGVELSRRLLDLSEWQRPIRVVSLLERIVAATEGNVVLLDNIEIVFDVALRQDPLRALKILSRKRTVVAAWSGSVEDGHVHYAVPGHPEYRRYTVEGLLVVDAEAVA